MTTQLAGARWWKFDFHTHTPASEDYGKGAKQAALRKRTSRDWLVDFMRAGVDCVAITDHNTGDGVDRLKAAYLELRGNPPQEFRPLHLFPGVEISVHGGIHVLAIFGPEKDTSDIDALLGAVGIRGAAKGSLATCTEQSFGEVVRKIRGAEGLPIPAHVDGENGVFKLFKGTTLAQALECEEIVAMELFDLTFSKPEHYTKRKLTWSEVLGSDSHHPSGNTSQRYPGSHFTWVKMGTPSIEGLRLALLDGSPLSIWRSDAAAGDPNEHARLVIEEIVLRDARYAGRGPSPLRAQFSPWLSTLIGGRGTGKSTVIEMLRLGLRRENDLPEELRGEFERFACIPESRGDRGALTSETAIEAILRKDGGRFSVRWRQDGAGPVIEEEDADGKWVASPGDVRARFPVRVFSQKQVFALASDPDALLRFIDEAPQVDQREWESQWNELQTRFLSLRSQVRELAVRLADRTRVEGELADVRRQLAVFEEGGHRELLVGYQRLGRQRRVLDDRDDELERAEERLRGVAADLEPSDLREEEFDGENSAEGEALSLLREAAERQREVITRLGALATELASFRVTWKGRLQSSAWANRESEIGNAYRALVERLEAEGVEDPTAYGALVQRRHALERKLAEMESVQKRMRDLEGQAEATLNDIEALRTELSRTRAAFLGEVLEGNAFVQMAVIPFGIDPRAAETELRKRLGREDGRLADDILSEDGSKGILAALYRDLPASPNERAGEIQGRIRDLKNELVAGATSSSVEGRSKWFHNHLRELRPDQLDHLRLWWPEDSLRVGYRRAGSGAFVPIEQGSPGQKSAAILAFLLSYGEDPIILDQPEDDLDNHLIYDLIVRQIRENKRQRQVIVATHNPNIVVNGDAEMVIAMDHQRGQCVVVNEGTGCLQERGVRDEICRVMEGGRQAFEARYKRLLEEVAHA